MKTKLNLGLLCLSVMSPMKSKSLLLLTVAAGLASALAFKVQAQTAVQAWAQIYSAPASNSYTDQKLVVDSSGNVIVAGNGSDESGGDWLVIKYTGAGVPLWTNRYNGPGKSGMTAMAVDGSGNIFVTGDATVKYSSSGVVLWTIARGATAMAVDGSGNVVLTVDSFNGTNFDYETTKYSSAGVGLWTNRWNGPVKGDTTTAGIAIDVSGNVFVTGYLDYDGMTADFATVAYSGTGVPLWTNLYNGTGGGYDTATAVAADGSGNVFVTGASQTFAGGSDYATIKYSGAGVPLWTNRFDAPGNSGASALAVNGSGSVFVTGISFSRGNSYDYDFATVGYSGSSPPTRLPRETLET